MPPRPDGYARAVVVLALSLVMFVVCFVSTCALALALVASTGSWWWGLVEASDVGWALVSSPFVVLTWLAPLTLLGALRAPESSLDPTLVALTVDENPELFRALEALCDEVSAPMPAGVWASHAANASVFFVPSLIRRRPRHLVIGLALVEALGRSEFKAVLAHELGHVAQRAMTLVGLVHRARLVAERLVLGTGRVFTLERLARLAPRPLSWAFWMLHLVGALGRVPLALAWRFVARAHIDLAHQMELAADDVAVSSAGATALLRALARLDFIEACMRELAVDLDAAKDEGLLTPDVFAHVDGAVAFVRERSGDARLGRPELVPLDALFDEGAPADAMHPGNAQRARRALALGVDVVPDDREVWSLFGDPERVRREVTGRFSREVGIDDPEHFATVRTVRELEDFLAEERAARAIAPRYRGIYEGRPITPGEPGALATLARSRGHDPRGIEEDLERLFDEGFDERVDALEARAEEHAALIGFARGGTGGVLASGRELSASEVRGELALVRDDLAQLRQWFGALDRRVAIVHMRMADALSSKLHEALVERYRLVLAVQALGEALASARGALGAGRLDAAWELVEAALARADGLELPGGQGARVGELLRGSEDGLGPPDGLAWAHAFDAYCGLLSRRCTRVDTKVLASLVRFQEEIAESWKIAFDPARHASPSSPSH